MTGTFTIKVIVPMVNVILAVVHIYLETAAVYPAPRYLNGPPQEVIETAAYPNQNLELLTKIRVGW